MLDSVSARPILNALRIATWSDDIVEGNIKRVRALFQSHGSDLSALVWDPPERSLPPMLAELHQIWRSLAAPGQLPHHAQVTPFAVRPALGYLALMDPVDGGTEFRYRLYGSLLAAISGFDLTGRLQSEAPVSAHVRELTIALDRAVYRQARPLYSCRRPMGARRVTAWHRLCLPLVNDSGAIARLLVANVPISATGHVLRV